MSNEKEPHPGRLRIWLTEGFNHAEDIVYIGLGLLLTATAFALLAAEILYFGRYVLAGTLEENIVSLILALVVSLRMLRKPENKAA